MKRLQAFKFEMRPNGQQQRQMRRFAGSCRVVFNEPLALQKARHERDEKKLGFAAVCKELTAWRNGAPLPFGAPGALAGRGARASAATGAQGSATRLHQLLRQARGLSVLQDERPERQFPLPRSQADQARSREQPHGSAQLGWLRDRNGRDALGAVRNVTASRSGGKRFISIQTEREVEQRIPSATSATSAIGIDMGITPALPRSATARSWRRWAVSGRTRCGLRGTSGR